MQSPIRVRRIRMTSAEEELVLTATAQPEAPPPARVPLEHLPWSLIPNRNKYAHRPRLRQGSAGGVHDGILYLFGGFEDSGHRSNSLIQYDMRTQQWSDLDCFGKIPPPRYGHACALYEHEMWCFGGQGPEEGLNQKNIMGDLNILDLRTREWRRGVVSCAGVNGRVNFLPLPRRGHSIVVHEHSLYLYGGSGPDRMYGKDSYFGDLQRLDLKAMCWHEPTMTGAIPEPRAQHAAAVVQNTIVVFGGQSSAKKHTIMQALRHKSSKSTKEIVVDRKCLKIEFSPPDTGFASNTVHVLDLHRYNWTTPTLAGTAPSARYGHVLTSHPQNPLVLFCFGGVTATGGYNDPAIHCLDLELHRWSTLTALDPIPPRTRHAMFTWDTQMMIFGGCGRDGLCVGDVYTIQLPPVPPPPPYAISTSEAPKATASPPPTRPQTVHLAHVKPSTATVTSSSTSRSLGISISPIKLKKMEPQKSWTSLAL
ncbi:hypothetical protein H310_09809 [Aphanomyces invadans]|uniref:Uncharacterized protein n=1 Tax=Aphanomyces invadans TaxID=157072 RepID=A0A024TSG5_9STRA|nr:hypothetical protein H310_09809 [Aphanomyces invadans]ETV96953.1 hypothetical protein H310_09809 [Aphanomyces invadans]|eukprot:XP_008874199.1 hypothetical protein H310_09809 [Aphanomyces invadans]